MHVCVALRTNKEVSFKITGFERSVLQNHHFKSVLQNGPQKAVETLDVIEKVTKMSTLGVFGS